MVSVNRIANAFHESSEDPVDREASGVNLSDSQQERLANILDEYLAGLEQGEFIDVDALAADDRQLKAALRLYVKKLDSLYGIRAEVDSEVDPPDSLPSSIPNQLGDFEILSPIGRGGMGIVYEAVQRPIGRRVALKLLPFVSSLDENQVARFQNESRNAGSLDHPQIVPVYSVGCEQGIHYFAMQLIDGDSLQDHLQDWRAGKQPITWRDLVGLIARVAEALEHAHGRGVIHRDIKPSNLLLDKSGKIWITDFGLAHGGADVALTVTGDLLGTVRYMSPEQASGRPALIDGRSDVYSLALTLYELLTLEPVFSGETATEILRQIDQHQITPLRKLRSDLPRDLETVLAMGMESRRDLRYETAADFAEDLIRVLDGEPTIARPPTMVDWMVRGLINYRRTAVSVIAIAMLLTVVLSIATVSFASLKQSADDAASKARQHELLARSAFDRMGAHAARGLAGIPAAFPVRSQLLEETLEYYELRLAELQAQGGQDAELANTRAKIGSLLLQQGKPEQAIEHLEIGEELMLAGVDDRSLSRHWGLALAHCQDDLGRAHQLVGNTESAARCFARSIATGRELWSLGPSSEVAKQRCYSLVELAKLLADFGEQQKARGLCEEALGLANSIDGCERVKASVQRHYGSMLLEIDPARAVRLVSQAVELLRLRADENPDDPSSLLELAVTIDKLGLLRLKVGQFRSARETLIRANELLTVVLERSPGNPKAMYASAATWNHIGLTSLELREPRLAASEFRKGQQGAAGLRRQLPRQAEVEVLMAGLASNLGRALQEQGDARQAMRAFREAVQHQLRAVDLEPKRSKYQSRLTEHREVLRQARLGQSMATRS